MLLINEIHKYEHSYFSSQFYKDCQMATNSWKKCSQILTWTSLSVWTICRAEQTHQHLSVNACNSIDHCVELCRLCTIIIPDFVEKCFKEHLMRLTLAWLARQLKLNNPPSMAVIMSNKISKKCCTEMWLTVFNLGEISPVFLTVAGNFRCWAEALQCWNSHFTFDSN